MNNFLDFNSANNQVQISKQIDVEEVRRSLLHRINECDERKNKDYVNKNGGKIKGDFKIVTIYSEKGRNYVDLFSRSVDESADVIAEARSINKISKDLEKTVLSMKTTVDEWKEAEGDRKSELLEKLRELNKQRAKLDKELDDAVAGKDHDLQLALTEAEELAYLELDVNNILND